jgi:hypothetical protein
MSQPLKRPFYNALENCPVVKDLEARDALLQALKEIEQPGWYFAALSQFRCAKPKLLP